MNSAYSAQLANTTHTRCRPTLSWMGGAVAKWVRAEGGREGGREGEGGRERQWRKGGLSGSTWAC